jgi:hypothetical protein
MFLCWTPNRSAITLESITKSPVSFGWTVIIFDIALFVGSTNG